MEKIINLPMKVAGVTFEGRQEMLKMFSNYPIQCLSVELLRDYFNNYDNNAIKVLVFPRGLSYNKYCIGFIPKEYAKYLSVLIDNGTQFNVIIHELSKSPIGKKGELIYNCEILLNQI